MDAVSPVIKLHKNDLPAGLSFPDGVAIDSETMGLNPAARPAVRRAALAGDGTAHLVQFDGKDWSAPRLKALLAIRRC
jgi:ribonuclease D